MSQRDNDYTRIILDVSKVQTARDFQKVLKKQLGFPDFYGMNWDAFWDAITGLVELPDEIIILGWNKLIENLPDDAREFEELMREFSKEFPMLKSTVIIQ